jgi:prevent-host-death family protein
MKDVTATEIKNKFGQILEAALMEPVTIDKMGRPVAVLMSIGEYQRLTEIEDRCWGEKALKALEKGFLSEEEGNNWLKGKLNETADK